MLAMIASRQSSVGILSFLCDDLGFALDHRGAFSRAFHFLPCALALAQDAVAIRRADRGTRASLAGVFHAAGLPGLETLCEVT